MDIGRIIHVRCEAVNKLADWRVRGVVAVEAHDYGGSATLSIDGNGRIAGTNDTSGEKPADVYQYLIISGGSNESSATITVP